MRAEWIPILFLATTDLFAGDLELATPPGGGKMTGNHAGPYNLRGYGKVEMDSRAWQTADGPVSIACFTAESPGKARIVGSKRLDNLLNYGAVVKSQLPGVTLEGRHGGFWKLDLHGLRMRVVVASTAAALQKAAKTWKAGSCRAPVGNFRQAVLGRRGQPAAGARGHPEHAPVSVERRFS